MTTIGAKPSRPAATSAQEAASAVTQAQAAAAAKERSSRRGASDADQEPSQEHSPPDELSDEFLIRVVRAFGGENGVVVDKKV